MPENLHAEKQKVIHFIQHVPYTDEERSVWLKELEDNDVSETLLDEMHKKLVALPAERFSSDWEQAKFSTDLASLIRSWRLSNARRQFKHGR